MLDYPTQLFPVSHPCTECGAPAGKQCPGAPRGHPPRRALAAAQELAEYVPGVTNREFVRMRNRVMALPGVGQRKGSALLERALATPRPWDEVLAIVAERKAA